MRGFLTINHNNLIFFFKLFGVYKKALTFAGFILCPLGTCYVCGYLLFSVSIREGSLEQTDAFGPEIVH